MLEHAFETGFRLRLHLHAAAFSNCVALKWITAATTLLLRPAASTACLDKLPNHSACAGQPRVATALQRKSDNRRSDYGNVKGKLFRTFKIEKQLVIL